MESQVHSSLHQNCHHQLIYAKVNLKVFYLPPYERSISTMLILNLDLDFKNSNLKIHFGANLDPKIQTCLFCVKIATHSISRVLSANPDLDF